MAVPNSSTVRWFHSEMAGAPVANNAAGSLLAVLDACLITGFGPKAADSLTVTSGVATLTISSGHDYEPHAVIDISGATPTELNGPWRVYSATPAELTFLCPGVADTTATGAIAIKRATPGHWEKTFSALNKGAYRSTHPDATGLFLRVDDSTIDTMQVNVRGYESMTDVDTGINPFPTEAQVAACCWRRQFYVWDTNPVSWTVIADGRTVYLLYAWNDYYAPGEAVIWIFGDYDGWAAQTDFDCLLNAHTSNPGGTTTGLTYGPNIAGVGSYIARLPGAVDPAPTVVGFGSIPGVTAFGTGEPFPSQYANGYLFHSPITVAVSNAAAATNPRLGTMPGILQSCTHATNTMEGLRVKVVPPIDASDRAVLLTKTNSNGAITHVAHDITGPWR
ncbi:MAG: hypothetical protein OQL08_09195 [Gammaproteobacteria bacterium]|nr:hypothetical protein [Gammaproteobacteria bacterium]